MLGPCAKGTVLATLVAEDGSVFFGSNECDNPQKTCPRGDMPSGQGYHLCVEVCRQRGHAEAMACKKAGEKARGSTVYLEGHWYACESCVREMNGYGVAKLVIGPPPGGNRL